MKYESVIGVLTYHDWLKHERGYPRGSSLVECIESIRSNTDLSKSVLVIANNSTDEDYIAEVEKLAREYRAALLTFRRNRGTSASWNAIARSHDCQRVVILNDDIKVLKGWDWAIEETLKDMTVGMISLCLANGHAEWNYQNPLVEDVKTLPIERFCCVYPTGALLAMRRETFDRFNGFDENLWIGFEEADLGIRLSRAGFTNSNVGTSGQIYKFAIHYGGATGYHEPKDYLAPSIPDELREIVKNRNAYFETKHGLSFPLSSDIERSLMGKRP